MIVSKISQKGQITIPKEIRKQLRAEPGDLIEYEIHENIVTIHRVEPFDRAFHSAVSETLTEWGSPEDEKAFRDL